MAELSPAAQAVLDAYENSYTESGLVAALRAAADQAVPLEIKTPWGSAVEPSIEALGIHAALYSIAAELEA